MSFLVCECFHINAIYFIINFQKGCMTVSDINKKSENKIDASFMRLSIIQCSMCLLFYQMFIEIRNKQKKQNSEFGKAILNRNMKCHIKNLLKNSYNHIST